jgi:hypothetical protein
MNLEFVAVLECTGCMHYVQSPFSDPEEYQEEAPVAGYTIQYALSAMPESLNSKHNRRSAFIEVKINASEYFPRSSTSPSPLIPYYLCLKAK